MSEIATKLGLSEDDLRVLDSRMADLSAEGIRVSEEHSGEMNFSGCHRGYCQAWD